MSPAMQALQSVGVTNSILILGVIFIAVASVIGMYWHIILPGAMMLAVACLFVSPDSGKTEVKTPVTISDSDIKTEKQQFMEDCLGVAEYTMLQCENLWAGRDADAEEKTVTKVKNVSVEQDSELKLLDVDNSEYKKRRADALNKPNAVIGHVTYR